jgi:hypothetical protein
MKWGDLEADPGRAFAWRLKLVNGDELIIRNASLAQVDSALDGDIRLHTADGKLVNGRHVITAEPVEAAAPTEGP